MSDLISRQAAIDAICKACSLTSDYHKCDGYPEESTWCEELVALRALPFAQPERKKGQNDQPESAKEYCAECDHIEMCGWYPYEGCEFRSIPQPQRKKGKWIFHETENDRYDDMICPFCKMTYTVDAYRIDDIGFTAEDFVFCPNCGARMDGESDDQ